MKRGTGKEIIMNSKFALSPEENAIVKEAIDIESGRDETTRNEIVEKWCASMSEEEHEELHRLEDAEYEYSFVEFDDRCPVMSSHPETVSNVCEACEKAREAGMLVWDCAEQCHLVKKMMDHASSIRDFSDAHGVHSCAECLYWGLDKSGFCSKIGKYVRAKSDACDQFHTETDYEKMRRTGTGMFETDDDRRKRIEWEETHSDQIAESRRKSRRRLAEKYATMLNGGVDLARSLYYIPGDYLKDMYLDFPDVFDNTPWKTYDELKRSFGEN